MNSDFIKPKCLRRRFQAMNAKVKALVFIASTVALISGLIMVWYIIFPPLTFDSGHPELMTIQDHTWGANNTYIVLSVKNTATKTLSVDEVVINNTVVNNVAYGGNLTGTTTHTLDPEETGTITITYPFSPGIEYVFQVGAAVKWRSWPYTATPP